MRVRVRGRVKVRVRVRVRVVKLPSDSSFSRESGSVCGSVGAPLASAPPTSSSRVVSAKRRG